MKNLISIINNSCRFSVCIGLTAVLGLTVVSCGSKKSGGYEAEYPRTGETIVTERAADAVSTAESAESAGEDEVFSLQESRYRRKLDDLKAQEVNLVRADGKKIWYNYRTSDTQYGYSSRLFEYDSVTNTEDDMSLNRTGMEEDYDMYVEGIEDHNGVLTIIMSEKRNSNGWVEGTYVWQYNCYSQDWKALAKECSGAEFVDSGNAVRVNYAEILNPEEPTFMQEYESHYTTIRL